MDAFEVGVVRAEGAGHVFVMLNDWFVNGDAVQGPVMTPDEARALAGELNAAADEADAAASA
jgi:hypothetical protein